VAAAKEVKARANHLAHAATASASMALVSATNQQLGLLNLEQQHVMASTANLPSHYCTVRSNKSTNSTHSGKVMAFGGKAEDGAAGAAEAGGGGSLDESNGPPPVWDIFSSVSRHEDDDNNVEKMRNDDARNKLVRRSSCGDISDFDGGGGGGVGGGGGDQNQPFPFDLSRHSHTIGGGSSSSSSSSSRDHTSPEEDTFSPLRDALSDVLAEFGEEALFSKVHKSQPSDNGSAPSETMFNGLEELLALGPDGVHDLGVPRIEAKKLVKRAGEMAEVRRLLVDCGVDAGKWFEPVRSSSPLLLCCC